MAKPTNDLGRDRVGTLLVRLALPAIAAQLINALYNIVDRMYIGHIEGVGDVALTGLGVCFPVLMFISALSALVGMGGGSRAAIRMGEGREDLANEILGSCAALLAVISAAVTVVFQLLKEPMLLLFGASGNTIGYAADYLGVYLWGTLFVQVSLGLNNFITTQGFSTYSMATVVIGAVTNIVLDPIFIFGFGMGVKGAALATILAQGVSALWVLSFLRGRRTRLRLQARCLRLRWSILAPVVAIGVSPFIMQSTESLVNIALNSSLKHYGGDLYVGAMTIASSIMQVLWMPFQGLAQGAQPIIGYNYGARKFGRMKRTLGQGILLGIAITTPLWLTVLFLPDMYAHLFSLPEAYLDATAWALIAYLVFIPILPVALIGSNYFDATGQALKATLLTLTRQILFFIPLLLASPHVLPLVLPWTPLQSLFFAPSISDITSTLLVVAFLAAEWRRLRKLEAHEALEETGAAS